MVLLLRFTRCDRKKVRVIGCLQVFSVLSLLFRSFEFARCFDIVIIIITIIITERIYFYRCYYY